MQQPSYIRTGSRVEKIRVHRTHKNVDEVDTQPGGDSKIPDYPTASAPLRRLGVGIYLRQADLGRGLTKLCVQGGEGELSRS